MRIVVIGGTGLIGSKVVTKLGEHGHAAVAAAPATGVAEEQAISPAACVHVPVDRRGARVARAPLPIRPVALRLRS